MSDYVTIQETFNPLALQSMGDWILEHTTERYLMATTMTLVTIIFVLLGGSIMPPSADAEPQNVARQAAAPQSHDRTLQLPSDARHTLWIPGDYQQTGQEQGQQHCQEIDVLVDFHGYPPRVRSSTRLAGLNCVVISVNYKGLSSVYRIPFSEDRQLFATILDEALAALRAEPDFPEDVQWRKIAISSFSAGFGAVREILKTQDYFDCIAGIFMVDSLYCGYVGDGTDDVQKGVVHPGLMKDFLRFAEASVDGTKVMIITHCMEPTPGYASTRETADYLLEKLNLKATPADIIVELPPEAEVVPGALRLYRQAKCQGFALYGSPGLGTTDHVEHLRHMAYWLPNLPLAKRVAP